MEPDIYSAEFLAEEVRDRRGGAREKRGRKGCHREGSKAMGLALLSLWRTNCSSSRGR